MTNVIPQKYKKTSPYKDADRVVQHMSPRDVQYFERTANNVDTAITFGRVYQSNRRLMPKESGREKRRAVYKIFQISSEAEILTKDFSARRSKLFNFHRVRPIIITKLRTKGIQNGNVCYIIFFQYRVESYLIDKMFKLLRLVEDSILQSTIYFSYFLQYTCNVLKIEYTSLFQVSSCITKQYGSF